MTKKLKQPWPTKAVMNQIYEKHLWGGNGFDFYSGWGSHNPEIINPYLGAVINFLKPFDKPLRVCDLGCGDFNIGKHLIKYTKNYIAIDIVESLIERNKKHYKNNTLEFRCLDIVKDDLPPADCVILRQVLQHLSNAEILRITQKLSNYKYVILTEHLPLGSFVPNKDIISGQGIRLKHQSGVNILESPFNFEVKNQKYIDEYILENNKEHITTQLLQVF